MNRSITEKKKKHLKACTQRPNASFDPKALVSVASSSPTVSTAVWVGCERERRSLLMSTLGESALLFCWVLFWKILQPRDRGGKLTQAVRKNLSIWVNCSGRGSLVIIIRDGFFLFQRLHICTCCNLRWRGFLFLRTLFVFHWGDDHQNAIWWQVQIWLRPSRSS